MAENIFRTLINRKIDNFINTFEYDAESLFKRDDRLIHPGEFGGYREKCLKLLLTDCIGKEYSVGEGFIYNKDNEVSTQCDVIIYNSDADGITSDGVANFYPVEEVLAVGEVKSNLTKAELETALRKLADTKRLFSYLEDESKDRKRIYADQVLPITFLVCKRINNYETLDEGYWDSVYEGKENRFRHNVVLSIENGCLIYSLSVNDIHDVNSQTVGSWGHPVILGKKLCAKVINAKPSDRYFHFYLFLGVLRNSIETIEKKEFPIIRYLGIRNDGFEKELLDMRGNKKQ